MRDNFQFHADTHIYLLNGKKKMPSVSEIIAPLHEFGAVPFDVLANAQKYGKSVHAAIAYWLKGELDEGALDPGLVKPFEAFKKWYGEYVDEISGEFIEVESPRYHTSLRYGGTPDLVFRETIVDIKTRPYSRTTDTVQLAAYSKLFPDFPPKDLIVLELGTDGSYMAHNANDRHAWGMFRKLLDNYNAQQKIKTLIKQWKERV